MKALIVLWLAVRLSIVIRHFTSLARRPFVEVAVGMCVLTCFRRIQAQLIEPQGRRAAPSFRSRPRVERVVPKLAVRLSVIVRHFTSLSRRPFVEVAIGMCVLTGFRRI